MKPSNRIPRFSALRIVFAGLSLYFVLFASLSFFLSLKDIVAKVFEMELHNGGNSIVDIHQATGSGLSPDMPAIEQAAKSLLNFDARLAPGAGGTKNLDLALGLDSGNRGIGLPFIALLLGFLIIRIYHRPLYRAFRKLRAGGALSPGERIIANARLSSSPYALAFIPTGILVIAAISAGILAKSDSPREFNMMPWIDVFSLVLSGLFIFIYQRHRVQAKYVKHLAYPTQTPCGRRVSVHSTFILITAVSVILPLAFTFLLLGSGISVIRDVKDLNPSQLRIVLGSDLLPNIDANLLPETQTLVADFMQGIPIVYVTVFDTLRISFALAVILTIVLVYVALIAFWTSHDILTPILELRRGMAQVAKGDFAGLAVIPRSNDELGDLVSGFNGMVSGLEERDKVKNLFGRYMSRELSEAILTGKVNTDGDRFEVTVLFADIRGFTALSADLPPEEVFKFLNSYLERMTRVIALHNGMIDKFLGDGILVGFGLPVATKTHAKDALGAARGMLAELAVMNAEREGAGLLPIRVGIGLHSGPVFAGNQGSSIKSQYTIIGDTVNVASRIEDLTKERGLPLLLSDTTCQLLSDGQKSGLISLEPARLRGKAEPVSLWGQA